MHQSIGKWLQFRGEIGIRAKTNDGPAGDLFVVVGGEVTVEFICPLFVVVVEEVTIFNCVRLNFPRVGA